MKRCGAIDGMKKRFRPEFVNRIDDIVVFSPLTESKSDKSSTFSIKDIQEKLAEKNITLKLTEGSKARIVKEAYSPLYGARPVKRYLQKYIETEIAKNY